MKTIIKISITIFSLASSGLATVVPSSEAQCGYYYVGFCDAVEVCTRTDSSPTRTPASPVEIERLMTVVECPNCDPSNNNKSCTAGAGQTFMQTFTKTGGVNAGIKLSDTVTLSLTGSLGWATGETETFTAGCTGNVNACQIIRRIEASVVYEDASTTIGHQYSCEATYASASEQPQEPEGIADTCRQLAGTTATSLTCSGPSTSTAYGEGFIKFKCPTFTTEACDNPECSDDDDDDDPSE